MVPGPEKDAALKEEARAEEVLEKALDLESSSMEYGERSHRTSASDSLGLDSGSSLYDSYTEPYDTHRSATHRSSASKSSYASQSMDPLHASRDEMTEILRRPDRGDRF